MNQSLRGPVCFGLMALMLVIVGFSQSWSLALSIVNLCLISSIMALGLNMQWGYAGLFNVGVMGFAALGGVAAVLVSAPPVTEAWAVAGWDMVLTLVVLIAAIAAVDRVVAVATGYLVWALESGDSIVSVAAVDQPVAAATADNRIVTVVAVEIVVSVPTTDEVVTTFPLDDIVAFTSNQSVSSGTSFKCI